MICLMRAKYCVQFIKITLSIYFSESSAEDSGYQFFQISAPGDVRNMYILTQYYYQSLLTAKYFL